MIVIQGAKGYEQPDETIGPDDFQARRPLRISKDVMDVMQRISHPSERSGYSETSERENDQRISRDVTEGISRDVIEKSQENSPSSFSLARMV